MNFSSNLKNLRKDANLTQKQLADKLGVSLGTIRNWEQGINVPKYPAMKILSEIFNVSLPELTGLDNFEVIENTPESLYDKETLFESTSELSLSELKNNGLKTLLNNNYNQLNSDGKQELVHYSAYLVSSKRYKHKD
ncbi:helix-turn-helix transcriptional regulator [Proteiniclasticum sp. QWL-01]|uniref:helix-turn-helix domain-containing protein n=1 Tax=Proteiniclasticum sp. QWL-01 TaxID=3036945 RepID=UPI00240F7685|nr:helix-turn-helix transcriptional regulator [Proteiniclasticum sp. QWL-01]WFF73009.1 helix-turn-helix transcriptional regulator [Proteiniclasticum sp. QWL-01]